MLKVDTQLQQESNKKKHIQTQKNNQHKCSCVEWWIGQLHTLPCPLAPLRCYFHLWLAIMVIVHCSNGCGTLHIALRTPSPLPPPPLQRQSVRFNREFSRFPALKQQKLEYIAASRRRDGRCDEGGPKNNSCANNSSCNGNGKNIAM